MLAGGHIARLGAMIGLFFAGQAAAQNDGTRPLAPDDADSYIIARGEDYEGWPVLELSVNGLPVATLTIGSLHATVYTVDLPVAVLPIRQVQLAYVNDHVAESGPGDRNVFVSRLVLDGREFPLGEAAHLDENQYNYRGALYANARLRWVLPVDADGDSGAAGDAGENECGASGEGAICLPVEELADPPAGDDCTPADSASDADWEAANRYAAQIIEAEQDIERATRVLEDARYSYAGQTDDLGSWGSGGSEHRFLNDIAFAVRTAWVADLPELRALRARLQQSMQTDHGDEIAGYLSPAGPDPNDQAALDVLDETIRALERLQDAYARRTELRGLGRVICRD